MLAGNHTDKISALIAVQHQGLEYTFDVFSQRCRHMHGTQVVLVHFVRNQFVRHFCLIQQACHIGLVNFHKQFRLNLTTEDTEYHKGTQKNKSINNMLM